MGKDLRMDSVAMKVRPIARAFRSFDKDDRQRDEEKRIKLLLDLLCEMNVPASKVQFLKLKTQRYDTLKWLSVNLAVNNSHHKNYNRAKNIIDLLLKTCRKP